MKRCPLIILLMVPLLIGAACVRADIDSGIRSFDEDIALLPLADLEARSDIPSAVSTTEIANAKDGEYGSSIDQPVFVSMREASERLDKDVLGILVDINGTKRYYPFQLLSHHEIVNDTIEGLPIMVTYCPRCRTGVVFERNVMDQAVTFGVSGKLYRNNLLMYNKDGGPQSLWSQAQGKAVVGAFTGTELRIFPSVHMKWGQVLDEYGNGEVEVLGNGLDELKPFSLADEQGLCSGTK